ncbi:GTPase ObgE [Lachnoanaerobaculum saburreum]|uniref:GTPase Obg n=1 Tax=Lachnoanaerobaculum saburreum DSM 3986 TaxID=887325 RepID=E6LPF0_9FIRM|nr:GTPase ObgE [Lachnoanaerobaculum saburreum]EFU76219.1 Obg family GTPase CgtA [Lachnoanaerobaculum saburreum DSM 3986]
MFADSAKIFIKSGKGGDGHVSFRRELFVAAGGPDGGDGGKGGDIIFEVDEGLNTLTDFRMKRKYVAGDGEPGGKRKCHGADAKNLTIKVPEGTVIKDFESGKVIADMSGDNKREVILKGGKGGFGNMNFATATMQVPKFAKPGQPGKEMFVLLELKVIADVGLVGFPNVGKSTLLSRVSNAKPKIANYHFTTLDPHLGVVDVKGAGGFVMADIPGLIEGASEGVGLGHDFLRHIERTKVLVHVVDAASTEGRDPVEDIKTIINELKNYDESLLGRPQVIAANKIDAIYSEENDSIKRIKEAFPDIKVFPISGVSGKGIPELLYELVNILSTVDKTPTVFEKEFEIDYSSDKNLPFTVEIDENGVFVVEGPRIEKMLGYTNLDSEKGFDFFQKFLKTSGILEKLEEAGIEDGNTVRMYGHEFDYYK